MMRPLLEGPYSSGPALICTFSRGSAFKYAFPISAARRSRSFNAAANNRILTLSLDATEEYVDYLGTSPSKSGELGDIWV